MQEIDEFCKYLRAKGLPVGRHRPDNTFYVGNNWFILDNGEILCPRGVYISLAAPDALDTLVEILKHCAQDGKCPDCKAETIPEEIPSELYELIGWFCGKRGANCDKLCGRYGLYTCPLK